MSIPRYFSNKRLNIKNYTLNTTKTLVNNLVNDVRSLFSKQTWVDGWKNEVVPAFQRMKEDWNYFDNNTTLPAKLLTFGALPLGVFAFTPFGKQLFNNAYNFGSQVFNPALSAETNVTPQAYSHFIIKGYKGFDHLNTLFSEDGNKDTILNQAYISFLKTANALQKNKEFRVKYKIKDNEVGDALTRLSNSYTDILESYGVPKDDTRWEGVEYYTLTDSKKRLRKSDPLFFFVDNNDSELLALLNDANSRDKNPEDIGIERRYIRKALRDQVKSEKESSEEKPSEKPTSKDLETKVIDDTTSALYKMEELLTKRNEIDKEIEKTQKNNVREYHNLKTQKKQLNKQIKEIEDLNVIGTDKGDSLFTTYNTFIDSLKNMLPELEQNYKETKQDIKNQKAVVKKGEKIIGGKKINFTPQTPVRFATGTPKSKVDSEKTDKDSTVYHVKDANDFLQLSVKYFATHLNEDFVTSAHGPSFSLKYFMLNIANTNRLGVGLTSNINFTPVYAVDYVKEGPSLYPGAETMIENATEYRGNYGLFLGPELNFKITSDERHNKFQEKYTGKNVFKKIKNVLQRSRANIGLSSMFGPERSMFQTGKGMTTFYDAEGVPIEYNPITQPGKKVWDTEFIKKVKFWFGLDLDNKVELEAGVSSTLEHGEKPDVTAFGGIGYNFKK